MRHRFEVPLTVVVGGAGYGKTTLLAQAVHENELEPHGRDVWLLLSPRDRTPEHLLSGLGSALVGDPDAAADVDGIVERVLVAAPERVALVLDDAHHLDGSDAWPVLAELLERLPTNGHLVIGSRTMPPLGVRRRQASEDAVVIDEAALAFTPDELAALADARGIDGDPGELPPWPALAVLSGTVGHQASIEYVWDEILASLPAPRRRALALLSRFERLDDELVAAVAGDGWRAEELVAGLPLVDSVDGRYRLHDLWRQALAAECDPAAARDGLEAGAELLIARGELVAALGALRDAGALDRARAVVRGFASQSISAGLDRVDAASMLAMLPLEDQRGALGAALRTVIDWNDDVEGRIDQLQEAATSAGDDELVALACWRRVQRQGGTDPEAMAVSDEMRELASKGWPLARAAIALVRSHEGESRGDVAAALAALDDFAAPDPRTLRSAVDSRLVALGQPERVPVTLEEVLADGVREPVSAHAVWLRGDIDPDVAWPIAATLPTAYGRRRMADVQVPLLGIVTAVGLAAGEVAAARALAAEALALSSQAVPQLALFAEVADALVRLVGDGDDAGREALEALVARHPLEPWPAWAHLGALAPLRAHVAGTEWLDDAGLGPSLQVAVDAGRAVAEIRSGADPSIAAALPWDSPALLRAQVPLPMLCELAVAASLATPGATAVGRAGQAASALLAALPERSRVLQRLTGHPHRAVRSAAQASAASEPVRPDHDLRVVALGELAVERSDGVPVGGFGGRGRVRQLLGVLVVERSVHRADLAARMWPELEPEQAANNLRGTLHKLLGLLEPDREASGSWWVRTSGDRLLLSTEGLAIDVDEFDRHLGEARRAEQHGAPSLAADHYRAMLALYGGDLLAGVDDVGVLAERTRLRALAYSAACRLAELGLARGEPEQALAHAVEAERLDDLGERAVRLVVSCHLALGARAAALETGERFRARLAEHGVAPDAETEALLARAC